MGATDPLVAKGMDLPSGVTPPSGGGVDRQRLEPASWSRYGATGIQPRADAPSLSTGDSVRHETLGEGVVTAVEAGGVVTVRFAADGSERRLVLDYAPLQRI